MEEMNTITSDTNEKKHRRVPRLGYIPRGGDPEYLEEMKELRRRLEAKRRAPDPEEDE